MSFRLNVIIENRRDQREHPVYLREYFSTVTKISKLFIVISWAFVRIQECTKIANTDPCIFPEINKCRIIQFKKQSNQQNQIFWIDSDVYLFTWKINFDLWFLNRLWKCELWFQVKVVEFHNTDISAYTYEKTIMMEERSKFLQELRMTDKEKEKEVSCQPDIVYL